MATFEIDDSGATFLVRVSVAAPPADPAAWAREHAPAIDVLLNRHGAAHFVGFRVDDAARFEQFVSALVPTLDGGYGDLPRLPDSDVIYAATPYPPDRTILFHNEASHTARWPRRQAFCCLAPAPSGGANRVVDGRRVLRALSPTICAEFEERGLCYVRNFVPPLGVAWQTFYRTSDRAAVERMCLEQGTTIEWRGDRTLRTRQRAPAVIRHATGDRVWFNQIQLHHPSCLDDRTREALGELYPRAEDLPRHVQFGDGGEIPDQVVADIGRVLRRESVAVSLARGELLLLDNELIAHAREPYKGARKVLVALGNMSAGSYPPEAR